MPATIMHTASTSFIIQFPSLSQYNTVARVPKPTDIKSIILIVWNTFVFMVLDLESQII